MSDPLEARLARRAHRRPPAPDALLSRVPDPAVRAPRRTPDWGLVAPAVLLLLLLPWLPASNSARARARGWVHGGLCLVQELLRPLQGDRR